MFRTIVLVPLILTVATACGIVTPEDRPRSELEENRELWERVRPQTYTMVLTRLCFCTPEGVGPVRIRVQGTVATERVYVDSGEAVAENLAPYFPTVDGLFDVIRDALDRDAHEVRVTYDAATGIPVDLWIDYEANAADEEVGYQVTLPLED